MKHPHRYPRIRDLREDKDLSIRNVGSSVYLEYVADSIEENCIVE